MASNSSFIAATVSDVQSLLDHFEAAQGIAAARSQEWTARATMGTAFALVEGDFDGRPYTLSQFNDILTALNHLKNNDAALDGTTLYRIKE